MQPASRGIATIIMMSACASAPALAQDAPVYAPPTYPAQPAYAGQPVYGVTDPNTPAGRKGRMRQFFATTLSAVVQGSGVPTATGISELVVGGIADWFDRKKRRKQERKLAAQGQVSPNYQGATPVTDSAAPVYAPPPAYGAATDAAATYSPPQYTSDPVAQFAAVQFYDTQTGAAAAPPAYAASFAPTYAPGADATAAAPAYAPSAASAMTPAGGELFAGIAYEIHALRPDGSAVPVNPAAYEFHSGDQFVVMYRPTLPGRMRVVNVNPAGRETEIDSVEVAAGQLLRLGPYRFENLQGDESLRFIITPCSNPALLTATRDIVKVDAGMGTALNLGNCANALTRSIRGPRTRDIRKVAVEGNTGFAFDPVSQQELASGELAPRELTVLFRHR
jgi:hypothetical protein